MKHVVIESFNDTKDNGHRYLKDDEYPRAGYEPSEKRLKELSSSNNLSHRPMIREVKEERPNKKATVKEEENV